MATEYKKLADDMRHVALDMMTDDQYVKCKEAIHKCIELSTKNISVSSVMPIGKETPIRAIRCDTILELGEILSFEIDISRAEMVLSRAIEMVSENYVIHDPLSVITNAGTDATEAIMWAAVLKMILIRDQLDMIFPSWREIIRNKA